MPYVSLSKLSCRALNSEARTNTITIVTPTTTNQMQTVLSVGAAGKIGASAIHAALSSEFHVLAMVRKHISAEKLFYNVGAHEGITTVEADIMSDRRVKGVVEKVRKGKLPVYAAGAGELFDMTSILDLTTEGINKHMQVNFEPNFFAYQGCRVRVCQPGDLTEMKLRKKLDVL
ncbi:hypothetical protein V6Z98_001426 [Aspergillus fumigatus]|nr:hypothetical protein KXX32_008307 [Aspergillus fumigatus]